LHSILHTHVHSPDLSTLCFFLTRSLIRQRPRANWGGYWLLESLPSPEPIPLISRSVIAPNSLIFSCFWISGCGSAGTLLPPLEVQVAGRATAEELLQLRLQFNALALTLLIATKIHIIKL
jgi:hypothetical protein